MGSITVVTFPGTHDALRAEREAKRLGLDCRLVSNPRAFTADCGLALEIEGDVAGLVGSLAAGNPIRFTSVHVLDASGREEKKFRFV